MTDQPELVEGTIIRAATPGDSLTVEPTGPGDLTVQLWAYNGDAGGEQAGVLLTFGGCIELMLALAQRVQQMQRDPERPGPDGLYPVPQGRRRYHAMVWLPGEADGQGWVVWDYATHNRVAGPFGPRYLLEWEAQELAAERNAGAHDG